MKIEKIKPVPKYIEKRIKIKDIKLYPNGSGNTRFYAYLTKNDKELVKVTVAVRNRYKKWYCKQVAVHGIHSEICFIKDIVYYYIAGYVVGWFDEGLSKTRKWFESNEWDFQDDKSFDPFAPVVNKEYLGKFPEYKYSASEIYNGVDILQYLRLYEEFPQIEYLTKAGFQGYAKSKQLLRKISKDKKFRKWLINNRKTIFSNHYYISTILTAYNKNKPLAEIQKFAEFKKCLASDRSTRPLRELFKDDLEQFFFYTVKHEISPHLYLDYLRACQYLELDMTLERNRFPHNFMHWHDLRIDEYRTARALADEKEKQELYKKFTSVAEKYTALQKNGKTFAVIIAKSPNELSFEGEALHHCVGSMNYESKIIREETLIFFIRSKDALDVPFVTVEYSLKSKKILQCYGMKNTLPDKRIQNYIYKIWLPHANKQLKKLTV